MNPSVDRLRQPRTFLLNIVSGLSTEQLNKIPEGYNNNIIWNLGHMVAAQQGICYKRAGVDMAITEDFFETYKSGTKPEKLVDAAEIASIKELLLSTLDTLEADIDKGIFANYNPVMTRYGVELISIDSAVGFLPFHDGFHMGYVLALKRAII
jgi:hypothetical protein